MAELFLCDYLPHKATLETEQAVDRYAPEFRRAMTDQESFGPAKSPANAMRPDGAAVDKPMESTTS